MERGVLALPRGMTHMLTGIVLAGGRSSRMGRDKALLEIDGRSLLDRAIDLLHAAGAARVVVSGDRPSHGGVPDAWPEAGPLGGIASVLPGCGDGAIVVVPVDMPELDAVSLRRLVDALVAASAARFAGHPLPWAARVDDGLRSAVGRLMGQAADTRSMRALHAAVDGVDCAADNARGLCNVNTPTEWEALRR